VGTGANSLLDQTKEAKMRRVTIMLAAVALIVSLFAVVAYAADIQGTNSTETLNESNKNDQIHALVGDDIINANLSGNDTDRVHGNKGIDTINVKDGDPDDTAWGGRGDDTCFGDTALPPAESDEFHSCEVINP
jgi:Ca2+-binding RTX toxin-like protein